MDTLLYDELLEEIFHRLPTAAQVSLVSKRWRRLLRLSTTSLRLRLHTSPELHSLSHFLRQHPFLSSLLVIGEGDEGADSLLIAIANSCPNLRHLILLSSPVSLLSLCALASSSSCVHLSSIEITVFRRRGFCWLNSFESLKSLSISFADSPAGIDSSGFQKAAVEVELKNLENLSLTGISAGDSEVGFLWRNCNNIKKLRLTACQSLGDFPSFQGFLLSGAGLQELELRTSRAIADVVLLTLAGNSPCLISLLIHDGASKNSLLQFINQINCKNSLRTLDFRLPLDLNNTHLLAVSQHRTASLSTLRLESCCIPIGEGLKTLTAAAAEVLEELALVNCAAVERESGLLTAIGQNLRRLKKLDLSYNENLRDKEIISMLASCSFLSHLKLWDCRSLTDSTLYAVNRSCKQLEYAGLKLCSGIGMKGVEYLVLNSRRLRKMEVEEAKISDLVKKRRCFDY